MVRAVRSRNWKTNGTVLIIAAFCLLSHRLHADSRLASTIETVNVGQGSLAIRALTGYCNELDRSFFSPLERSAQAHNVIAVSAPCRDLAAFKSSEAAGLPKYMIWSLASTDSGALLRVPAGTIRSSFANEMAETVPEIDLAETVSEVAKNGSKIGIICQGIIDREVDAVYEITVESGNSGGTVKIVLVVTGIATIHHLVLSISAYDAFKDGASLSETLASVKSLMDAALSDNPDN